MSGRDTPSSQVTEDGGDESQNRQPRNDDGSIDNVDHQVLISDGLGITQYQGFGFTLQK